jgi:hypothetical protein
MDECDYGDTLQTEAHVFWDCKMNKDKRTTVTYIVWEKQQILPSQLQSSYGCRKKMCAKRMLLHKLKKKKAIPITGRGGL